MISLLSIADILSISNAIFGVFAIFFLFSSIIESFDLRLRLAFSFIFLGLLIDGLDGIVARKNRKSEIGDFLESMADMTTLVIAPAGFIYFIYSDLIGLVLYRHIYLLFALVLFLAFGIIRLASFYHMKQKRFYIGLPASVSTIILIVIAYFQIDFIYILPSVVIIGAFMASDIHFPKPTILINSIATILIFLTLILDKSYFGFAPILLVISILIYAVGGPIYLKFLKK